MPGVYISYPFCRQKCSFCNFASDVGSPETRERYHAALLEEFDSYTWPWMPETVYFGGGTPSLMPAELLAELMKRIPAERLEEVTIESAPGTFTREAVQRWRVSGVNRVSLGVQSFMPDELRLTGRRHTAARVQQDIELLRQEGIANINCDLIAGLPEQTASSWKTSLEWIECLNVPHVSVYIFESDEDSRLGKELSLGGVRYGAARMPSEELTAAFYERAVARLAESGLEQYEISNFARPGFESRHNLKYWQLEPYTGFGLDAHSYDGQMRWSNPDSLPEYLNSLHAARERVITDAAEEHFFVGLRLRNGIEPTAAEWARFAGPIEKWTATGMLELQGSRLRLSSSGVLLSNEIFQEFVLCPEMV